MAVPPDSDGPGWQVLAIGAWSLVTILFGWIANSLRSEQKEHGARLDALERTYVTREELEKSILRLEAIGQRKHEQNLAYLQRIEDKIERGGETRHDIRDGVGAIQLMLRATLAEFKKEQGSRRDDERAGD